MNTYGLSPTSTPAEVRAGWAEALESGEYSQCQRRLTDFEMKTAYDAPPVVVDGRARFAVELRQLFCALGVLQELAYHAGVTRMNANAAHLMGNSGVTDEVAEWAGIDIPGSLREPVPNTGETDLGNLSQFYTVMVLNDAAQWDFTRIAKEIRNDNLETA